MSLLRAATISDEEQTFVNTAGRTDATENLPARSWGFNLENSQWRIGCAIIATKVQQAYPDSIQLDYILWWKKSGQCALHRRKNGTKPFAHLPDTFTFALDKNEQPSFERYLRYENII